MYFDNKRLALTIFWIVLGILLIILSVFDILDSSIYAGIGGALTAIGVLQLVRTIRYRKDSEYREKIDIEINDVRNRYLRMKSWSWTGYIVVLIEGIGVVVALILGQETVQLILSYSVCLILVVYWLTYVILGRKY